MYRTRYMIWFDQRNDRYFFEHIILIDQINRYR